MPSTSPPLRPAHKHSKHGPLVARGSAFSMIVVGCLLASAASLGATSSGCGDFSFGFAGTRLINDGISNRAGPFAIELPAGTYSIVMVSSDNHESADYQTAQTGEQWYFTLDNGYTSPATADIPATETRVITSLSGVTLTAASAISVHHVGEGGVNSVNVDCIGFTAEPVVEIPETTAVPTTAVPKVVGPASTTSVAPVASIAPATTAAIPTPTTAAPLPRATPPTTTASAVKPSIPTKELTPATTTTVVEVEVASVVEVNPNVEVAVLAHTGVWSDLMYQVALLLIATGLATCGIANRIDHRNLHPVTTKPATRKKES